MGRHLRAEATGIKTRSDSLKWIVAKVKRHLPDPQWHRADLVANIGVTPSRIFRRIGMRRYPPYGHRQIARELFGLRETVCLPRMESNRWVLAPGPTLGATKARPCGCFGQRRREKLIARVAGGFARMPPPLRRRRALFPWKLELFSKLPPKMR